MANVNRAILEQRKYRFSPDGTESKKIDKSKTRVEWRNAKIEITEPRWIIITNTDLDEQVNGLADSQRFSTPRLSASSAETLYPRHSERRPVTCDIFFLSLTSRLAWTLSLNLSVSSPHTRRLLCSLFKATRIPQHFRFPSGRVPPFCHNGNRPFPALFRPNNREHFYLTSTSPRPPSCLWSPKQTIYRLSYRFSYAKFFKKPLNYCITR